MPWDSNNRTTYALLAVFGSLIYLIHSQIERYESAYLLSFYVLSFLIYLLVIKKAKFSSDTILYLGIGFRVLMFFDLPSLSDDFYRFIWDGRLVHSGVHPFMYFPSHLIELDLVDLDETLFNQLNSKDYFTVYPLVGQLLFYLSSTLQSSNFFVEITIMRSILMGADIGSMILLTKLLRHYDRPKQNLMLFAFNPLLILELIGNVHFEGIMIFFILLFVHLYSREKVYWSSIPLALAISTKIIPLIFIPYVFFKHIKSMKGMVFSILTFLVVIVLTIPLLSFDLLSHLGESVMLFINNFEFNASLYFLLRWVGHQWYGYNQIAFIGPFLSMLVFISIMGISIYNAFKKGDKLPETMVWAIGIYLLCSTTVHPWYCLPLFSISLITKIRFPLLWTLTIFLSYIGYNFEGYDLSPYWSFLEYIPVFIYLIYEIRTKEFSFSSVNDVTNRSYGSKNL